VAVRSRRARARRGDLTSLFYAFGQLLLNDQRVYGPTQSRRPSGGCTGLQSGGYGWVYRRELLAHPLDAAFMLHKIHPLSATAAWATRLTIWSDGPELEDFPKRREYVDLFLATTIGYGNMGWLSLDWASTIIRRRGDGRSP
jgi:hypothetical protein